MLYKQIRVYAVNRFIVKKWNCLPLKFEEKQTKHFLNRKKKTGAS